MEERYEVNYTKWTDKDGTVSRDSENRTEEMSRVELINLLQNRWTYRVNIAKQIYIGPTVYRVW